MNNKGDIEVEFGACSDVGQVRENNEDSFRVAPEINLFVLSDGMGGQSSGEIASRLASETVIAHCREAAENPALPFFGRMTEGASEFGNRLASAFHLANHAVHQAAQANTALGGMGATLVAVLFADERVSVAHVGDSRAYRLRNGRLEPLTQDHSFVAEQVRQGRMTEQEAQNSNLQNVLLRAVGVEREIEVDLNEELFADEDVLLLCSDGLTKELSEAQIAGALAQAEDADTAAKRLIQLANDAGGNDNITAIVVRHAPRLVGSFERLGRWFKGS